uniref:Secreted protein n=1 Tax=Brugia malayi TaxID=6279 RepID=A0A912H163_BRUMA
MKMHRQLTSFLYLGYVAAESPCRKADRNKYMYDTLHHHYLSPCNNTDRNILSFKRKQQ